MDSTSSTALNEHQQNRLVVTCQYVDRLLAALEQSFDEAQSNSPFGRYLNDVAPAEQRLVRDYIARIRAQLVGVPDGQGLSPAARRVGVRHVVITHLGFIQIAFEELKPRYMRGYGPVAPDAEVALNRIVEELQATVRALSAQLSLK